MNTIIEDTADKMGCLDQNVFKNVLMHEAMNGRAPTLLLREVHYKALAMYREWLRNRTIDDITEAYCLRILTQHNVKGVPRVKKK